MLSTTRFQFGLCLVTVSIFGLLVPGVHSLWAQSETPRGHIILLPARGGTDLSFQIQAEADYLAARGDLAESIAVARKIHANAFAKEIQNSVDYVDAYFQRQALNKKWRAEKNPNHLEREERLQAVRKQRIERQFQDVLKGNLTDELNWLLVELSGPTLALHYVAGEISYNNSEHPKPAVQGSYVAGDIPLEGAAGGYTISSADAKLIQFSDGRLTFSAADPQILEVQWPLALRAPEYDSLRDEFTAARDVVVNEMRSKKLASYENGERLIQATDGLLVALDKNRTEMIRQMSTAESQTCLAARRYLKSLTSEVHRAVQDGDRSLSEGAVKFDSGSVFELIRHMDRKGLSFAPPSAGGERVYRSLLSAMRGLYLTWGADNEM